MAEDQKTAQNTTPTAMQPGQVITPGGAPAQPSSTPDPAIQAKLAQTAIAPSSPEVLVAPALSPALLTNDEPVLPEAETEEGVSWTASEFISHEKDANWYLMLGVAAALLAGLIYLLTRDFISAGVVLFGALMLGIYAKRKPRQLPYRIDEAGIHIGDRSYDYKEFRSFSIVPEGAFLSIVLMPLKRFATLATIYYAPQDEEKITTLLSLHLPYEEHKHDPVDSLMQRIRF